MRRKTFQTCVSNGVTKSSSKLAATVLHFHAGIGGIKTSIVPAQLDVAQSGRVAALGADGRGFESLHPDTERRIICDEKT